MARSVLLGTIYGSSLAASGWGLLYLESAGSDRREYDHVHGASLSLALGFWLVLILAVLGAAMFASGIAIRRASDGEPAPYPAWSVVIGCGAVYMPAALAVNAGLGALVGGLPPGVAWLTHLLPQLPFGYVVAGSVRSHDRIGEAR